MRSWLMLVAIVTGVCAWQAAGGPASARSDAPAPSCEGDEVDLPSGATLCDGGSGAAETSAGPASILLTKTVGLDRNSCAITNGITISSGTDEVIYCYSVENTGSVPLDSHDLTDDKLGQLLDGFSYVLAPGGKTFATAAATLDGNPQVITNVATWTATNGTDTADSTAQATVTVEDGASAPTVSAKAEEGEASATWTVPTSNGGHPILGYRVTLLKDGAPMSTTDVGNVLTTEATGLENGHDYRFAVRALTETGPGMEGLSPTVSVDWWLPWSSASKAGTEIYTWLTGKAPTAGQLSAFIAAGDGGVLPGAQIDALRDGSDATGNVDPVIRLYSAYFLRPPDKSGFAFWLNRRRSGSWTIAKISANFADSSEFKNRYGSLSNSDFVTLVYQNVLGRAPDSGGLSYWTGQLDQRKKSRGQVMANFSESNEYRTKRASYVDASSLLLQLLGTSPSRSAAEALAAEIDGSTLAVTVRRLIHEPSFDARAG